MDDRRGLLGLLLAAAVVSGCARSADETAPETAGTIDTASLLAEMADLENLTRQPVPFYTSAQASSYSRRSHEGGEAWFANDDRGYYVRTETRAGRTEHVLADLTGPGTVTRFWSANPGNDNLTRFYFDGESEPRIAVPLSALFSGQTAPFGSVFSYLSGTGGNLYYPIPYARSLVITIEEGERPLSLYYEINYRSYDKGAHVESFDPDRAADRAAVQERVARALTDPEPAPAPDGAEWITRRVTIEPGGTFACEPVRGMRAVYEWAVSVADTRDDVPWNDPRRTEQVWRHLILEVAFDGELSIAVPLGDFFGSGPGVNPYASLFFTVAEDGTMTSRLPMPFRRRMDLRLSNAGAVPCTLDLVMQVGPYEWTQRSCHLRAAWGMLTRESWPPFDVTFLETTGEGKLIGSVYELANPVLIWWGEGDQKIRIDGEAFPSTFGTGTEDDYGYAYGYNGKFVRPYHAQTRVDGPWSGGHISLNRWYVLDALPFRTAIRFDQEIWHWMPCEPTWAHVVYWYARPGTPGPPAVDRATLAPVDLGIRENMLEPYEGEALPFEVTGGRAGTERLANCAGARHLVWRGSEPGDRLRVRFTVPEAGRYSVELNLCLSPDYGRQKISLNGQAAAEPVDCWSADLYWLHARLGTFELRAGENVLEVETLEPNPAAEAGNLFGLDYIFLVRQ